MKKFLKWTGYVAVGLVLFVAAAYGVLYGYTEMRLGKTFDVPRVELALRTDAESIERGRHIAVVRGCVDCHGDDLGGRMFIDAGPVGKLFASNLTRGRGGVGSSYTDADLIAAIRHGVAPDGRGLLFMPAQEFTVLSDQDVTDLASYIRSLPAVDNELDPSWVGPLGRLLFAMGQLPLLPAELIDHHAPRDEAPEPGPTAAYGAYLSTGCVGCHGDNFSGGKIPGTPPDFPAAANITMHETGIGSWSEEDFVRALRTGVRPDGRQLAAEMPWQLTAQFTDDELRAIWLHIQTVEPRAYGSR